MTLLVSIVAVGVSAGHIRPDFVAPIARGPLTHGRVPVLITQAISQKHPWKESQAVGVRCV